MDAKAIQDARDKLKQKFANSTRTGGAGSVRRKKKAVHKAASMDDKRLQSTLKRLGVNNIPGIEEVNIFKEDNSIIHFDNPKVQASIGANTYVISGTAETKSVAELLPGILSQLGPGGMRMLTEQLARGGGMPPGMANMMGGMMGGMGGAAGDDDAEDDMPALEESNFEEAAK